MPIGIKWGIAVQSRAQDRGSIGSWGGGTMFWRAVGEWVFLWGTQDDVIVKVTGYANGLHDSP